MICRVCEDDLPQGNFYFRKDNGKYRSECKKCTRKQSRKSWDTPVAKKLSQCMGDSKVKARKYNVYYEFVPRKELAMILEAQDYKCNMCKKDIKNSFTIDHIKAMSKNGGHYLENIQFLCNYCNNTKDPLERNEKGQFEPRM